MDHALAELAAVRLQESCRGQHPGVRAESGDRSPAPLVRAKLREFGIGRAAVTFEMTETCAIANISSAQRLMAAPNELGWRFVLNDFGKRLLLVCASEEFAGTVHED